ncbi:MAG: metallophosphoesterase, partial [Verrucomicrobiales bacterium]|nr:metallophosphoesterase [Verrucomicrobiales bacterium]
MTTFRWLHLTDLHLGMPGQQSLWPNVEEMFLKDLDYLRTQVGPWDLLLFTGDITQRGTKPEFDEVDKLLQKLWSRFNDWGFAPKLLAIPGNHDLLRPIDKSDLALVALLHNWHLPAVQTPFWEKGDSPQRRLISAAFQNFSEWWKNTPIPKPVGFNPGLLLGDCSASFEPDGFTLGIVGLNSAYLQLAGGNFEGRLHLDARQFHAVCDGHGADWTKRHDACLLLTHHPVEWLTPEAQKHFADEIHYPSQRFALHLFGHMHEASLTSVTHGGGSERRRLQGRSLFGLEYWGETQAKREHGYSLCELKLEDGELRLRIWPRKASEKQGGGRKLGRDDSFDLDERDGGTRSLVVKQSDRKGVVSGHDFGHAPISKVTNLYDPRNRPFYIPYHQKGDHVIGREGALAKVREQLTVGRRTTIGQTAVFQGLGGLGKTQLAVEYAYRYRDEYPNGVIWLTADQDIDAQLVDLAMRARWVAPESEHKFKLEIARHRLRNFSGCLIVFDNLEQISAIQDYLPEPPAEPHILATSRTEQPDFTFVPIDVLDPDQSLRLLIQEAGHRPASDGECEAARQIAATLGGLPLALELAGAYLSRRPVGWHDYLQLLQVNLRKALPHRLSSLTRHEADLYSTLHISEELFAEEPRLREILDVLTWSAPAPMGHDLLAALLGTQSRAELTGALGLGTGLRILQHLPGTNSYAIHRLVREVRREEIPLAERGPKAAELCGRIGDWFDALREDFRQLPRFEAEIDHLRQWHKHSLKFAPKHSSRITWLQAYPPFHRGQPLEIKRLVELALEEYQQHGSNDHALLAHLYNDLAYAIDKLGNPKRALELAEQALAI